MTVASPLDLGGLHAVLRCFCMAMVEFFTFYQQKYGTEGGGGQYLSPSTWFW